MTDQEVPESVQVALTEQADTTLSESNFFFEEQPPPAMSWAVSAVVFFTLLFRLYTAKSSGKKRREDIKRNREDEYWFRSVVLDPCLKEIDSFALDTRSLLDTAADELSHAESESEKAIISAKHLKDYRKTQQATIFVLSQLAIFGESYYHECIAILENLEDEIVGAVADYVYGDEGSVTAIRAIRVEAAKIKILQYLKDVHAKMF